MADVLAADVLAADVLAADVLAADVLAADVRAVGVIADGGLRVRTSRIEPGSWYRVNGWRNAEPGTTYVSTVATVLYILIYCQCLMLKVACVVNSSVGELSGLSARITAILTESCTVHAGRSVRQSGSNPSL